MAKEEIKINVEELEKYLGTLKQAIDNFTPYSRNFISETRDVFDEFNSDFFSKMDDVIKHFSDDIAGEILESVELIYTRTKEVVDTFKKVDQEIGENIKLEQ